MLSKLLYVVVDIVVMLTKKVFYRLHENKSPPKPATKQQTIQKKRPGQVVETDLVPRYVVEEKEQEVLSRDETIQVSQSVTHPVLIFS